jgi:hypothetical protein
VGGSACCHTRRDNIRLLCLSALAVPVALQSRAARAVKGWCRRDPIVKIGDLTARIVLSSSSAMDKLATGPTQVVVTVPAGVPTRFVATDPGFGHLGYNVRFAQSHELIANDHFVEAQVEVYTPAVNPPDGPLPLLVTFIPLGAGFPVSSEAQGLANQWVFHRSNLSVRDFAAPRDSPADVSDDSTPSDDRDKKAKEKDEKRRGKKESR